MVQNDPDLTVDVGAPDGPTGSDAATPDPADAAGAVMQLLAEGVPLTLLADLAAPDGPASQVILETEGLPDDAWWETETDTDQAPDQASDELVPDPQAARE
ncbi:MAG TPA: hypothetical protein VFW79_15160 [Cellulomonas sp.]|uniref:hypothetical protein n=1 Tax=Cellulomonas sp. TaxID=40001 RepID=UPI002E3505B4|nr:hypothetical protein [Cellulomonas sp.]HEX5333978.1 hypothetical protein [Cellulomonas sp.]